MIELYTFPTPNGQKVHIALEELGLDYRVHSVNIARGEQFEPEFLRISPNNKIPAIVDQDGPGGEPYALFESGAILMYLADKTGQLMPRDTRQRYDAIQWLMFQMGTVGPMLGQTHHFRNYAPERVPYAVERYTNEASRIYNVIDRRLGEQDYLAGDFYSMADIAVYPWLRPYENQGQSLEDYPNLKRWFDRLSERPAVQRGLAVLKDQTPSKGFDDEARENLFGRRQYARR